MNGRNGNTGHWFWRVLCWLNLHHEWKSDYHGCESCMTCGKIFEWH